MLNCVVGVVGGAVILVQWWAHGIHLNGGKLLGRSMEGVHGLTHLVHAGLIRAKTQGPMILQVLVAWATYHLAQAQAPGSRQDIEP